MSTRLTVAQYAIHRGCTRQAVYRALHEGRITRGADGRIDPDRADAAWQTNTLPTMRWPTSGGQDATITAEDLERLLDG